MRKIRVGVIGCGEAAQILHLPSLTQLADRFEVTALCDASRTVVEQVGNLWNIPVRCVNERELLERDDVDAVLITSPNHYHASTTIQAVNAGKHVLVEKPMCITLREADEIIAARQQSGVVVQVGYMRRYAPAFVEACEMVRAMDSIRLARVHDVIGMNAQIIRETSSVIRGTDISPDVIAAGRAVEDALFTEALGNAPSEIRRTYGLLLGLASHDTSAMREMLGMPQSVLYAAQRNGGNYVTAALDYGDFVCHVEIGVDNIPRYDTYLQVYSQTQIVHVKYDTPYVRNMHTQLIVNESLDGRRVSEQNIKPAWGDNFTAEWQAFYDNVTQNLNPKTSAEDARQDLALFIEMVRKI